MRDKLSPVFLVRAPAILWALVIFVLIAMPNPMIPRFGFWTFVLNSDKFWHAVMFFIQTATAWMAFFGSGGPNQSSRASLGKAVASSFAYGVVTELIQLALPDRFSSIGDIAANSAGILIFVLLYALKAHRPVELKILAFRLSRGV